MTRHRKAHRAWLWGVALSLPLMIGACDPDETVGSELDGYWWSEGYGLLFQVKGGNVQSIERTPVSCLPTGSKSLDRLQSRLATSSDLDKGAFALGSKATLSTQKFVRLDDSGFERLCPKGLTEWGDDPELNFEVLWHSFDQHYAFFGERKVDWDALYAQYRPTITKDTSSQELGRALDAMLTELKDAHVSLYVDGNDVVSVGTTLSARLYRECQQQEGKDCDFYDYVDDQYQSSNDMIKTTYLDDDVEFRFNGYARWGEIDDNTGYFRIDAMEGFVSGGYSTSGDLEAIEEVLDDMLDDLGDLPNMIVDVRLNGGGHDTVAVAIANRFADQRRVFGTKRPLAGGEDAAVTDMVIEPDEDDERFEGNVAVLISGETASAAEIFTMAMRALPHVTLIGNPTQGILSDELYRTLPNDWSFSLSNEIYLTHDHRLFEGIGVPPDVEASFLLPDDLERDIDPGIDTAITLLAERIQPKGKDPLTR